MKKRLSIVLTSIAAVLFLISCAQTGQQTKTETEQKDTAPKVKTEMGGDAAVRMINDQVKGFSIDGFPGGSAKITKNEDLENMKKIVALIKPIVGQVPDGYVMQITGHTANYQAENIQANVSKKRAEKIYNEIKKAGVPAIKMYYKGVGNKEPLDGYSDKDAKQRRVSFKAVKK